MRFAEINGKVCYRQRFTQSRQAANGVNAAIPWAVANGSNGANLQIGAVARERPL